jgi:uncharacterized protein (TIGR00730 family)
VLLFKYSYAFVAMPGGLGTLDELTEALTLIQTGKIDEFPIVLMGVSYWRPFTDMLNHMVAAGAMARSDLRLVLATDDMDAAMAHLQTPIGAFGLRRRGGVHPSVLLGERENPHGVPV